MRGAPSLWDQVAQWVGEAVEAKIRPVIGFSLGSAAGAALGAAAGAAVTKDKFILIKGRPDAEIDADLAKLKKMARVPDYR